MYCKICNACGEETCCPPTICKNHKDGKYCEWYFEELKRSHRVLRDLLEFLYEDEEKNVELINKLENEK